MSQSDDAVLYDLRSGVATITLNRPASLNSMNDALMFGLDDALKRIEADEEVRVLVLTGAGRGFCSGADLSASDDDAEQDGGSDPEALAAAGETAATGLDDVFNPPIKRLAELPVPTIARVNGVAAGGGMGLALGCDIAVAARSARFVCTFGPRLGIVPDLGTTFHLPHRVGKARARGIAMLGEPISAEQAVDWGLIWSVVDDDDLDTTVADLAARLARSSPDAMTRIRQSFERAESNSLSEQLDLERDHQREVIPRNMGEGAAAFREKREPRFDGRRWT